MISINSQANEWFLFLNNPVWHSTLPFTLKMFILFGNIPVWSDELQMYVSGFEIPSIGLFTPVMSVSLKSMDVLFLHLLTISFISLSSTAFRNTDLGFLSIGYHTIFQISVIGASVWSNTHLKMHSSYLTYHLYYCLHHNLGSWEESFFSIFKAEANMEIRFS